MPKCCYCDRSLPELRMIIVKEYDTKGGTFWYFCSMLHLLNWLENKIMRGGEAKRGGVFDDKAHLGNGIGLSQKRRRW